MYRLATKCTTKKRSEKPQKRYKCLWNSGWESKGMARLSTMTQCRERSHGATKACAINSIGLGCDCRCSTGVWIADADPQ